MNLKSIIDEDFINYKKPSMLIATCNCDWKCLKEQNVDLSICQNSELQKQKTVQILNQIIVERYLDNPITKAIVIGGLEPFLQFDELIVFIHKFRDYSKDDIVIYTGYYPEEIQNQIYQLEKYVNIIIKFGRFILNRPKKYDEVLGVWLASDNQYAIRIS